MKALRIGSSGSRVKSWQNFLIGRNLQEALSQDIIEQHAAEKALAFTSNASFGQLTHIATTAFQKRNGLVADGIVGNLTMGKALALGFPLIEETTNTDRLGPNWPPRPANLKPLSGTSAREAVFGRFEFREDPPNNFGDAIVITDNWESENIVRVEIPQLQQVRGRPRNNVVRFNRKAAKQFADLWRAWEEADLIDRVKTWNGSFVPRFMRNARHVRRNLSNHSFGTAFDINVEGNGFGAEPARVGKPNCVRELVELANEHGFFWGGHFRRRPDGMHFEVAKIL